MKCSDKFAGVTKPIGATCPKVAALDWPLERRLAFAKRDLWIGYDATENALKKLEDILVHPCVEQMPCLLVAAASRNGKSTVLKRFAHAHPFIMSEVSPPAGPLDAAKPVGTDSWSAVLAAMRVSHRATAPPAVKREQAINNFRAYRCRMLIVHCRRPSPTRRNACGERIACRSTAASASVVFFVQWLVQV